MYKFLHKICGYYNVTVTGQERLKFISRLRELQILFWDMRPTENGLKLKFSLFSYPLALNNSKDFNVEIQTENTLGIPFIVSKYKKRLGLLTGSILGLVLIFYSTLFVWDIRITGNINITESEILSIINQSGFGIGSYIPGTPVSQLKTHLLLTQPDLSSASINIKGTYVTVDVMERQRAPEIVDTEGYYHVVASCDGIIARIEAADGKPVVVPNETVVEGQILITGDYFGKYDKPIRVHARGKVFAKVYRYYAVTIPIYFEFKEYTGKTEVKTAYSILGHNFNLFLDSMIELNYFDAELVTQEITPFGFIKMPVKKYTLTAYEYQKSLVKLTQEAAEKKAYLAFLNWIENELEGEYLNSEYEINYDSHSNSVILRASAEIIIDIAAEQEFELKIEIE